MDTDDEEVFLRKAIEIMGEEEGTKLFDRVKELSADEDNIALYTEYSNQEMLMNTIISDAEDIKAEARQIRAEAKQIKAEARQIRAEAKQIKAEAKEIRKQSEADIAKSSKIFSEREKMVAENEKIASENRKLKEDNENKSKEIVKNMLANNLSKDLIANVTGLSLEEINSLE